MATMLAGHSPIAFRIPNVTVGNHAIVIRVTILGGGTLKVSNKSLSAVVYKR